MAKFLKRRKDKDEENEERPSRSISKRPSPSARTPAFTSSSARAKSPFSARNTKPDEPEKKGRWRSPWNRGDDDVEDKNAEKSSRRKPSLRGSGDADKSSTRRPFAGRIGGRSSDTKRSASAQDEEKKKSGRFGLGLRRSKDKENDEADDDGSVRRSPFGTRSSSRNRIGDKTSSPRTPSSSARSRFGIRSRDDEDDEDAPPSRAGTFRSRTSSRSGAIGTFSSRYGTRRTFSPAEDDEDEDEDAPPSRLGTFRSRTSSTSSRTSSSRLGRRSPFGSAVDDEDEDEDAPPSRLGTFRSRTSSTNRTSSSRLGQRSPFGSAADDDEDEDEDAPPSRLGTFRSRTSPTSSRSTFTRGKTPGGLPPRSESQRRAFGSRSTPSVVDKKEDEEKKKKRRSSLLPFGKKKEKDKKDEQKKKNKSKPAKRPSTPTGRRASTATTRQPFSSGRSARPTTSPRATGVASKERTRGGTTSKRSPRTSHRESPREKGAFTLHQGMDFDRKIDLVGVVLVAFALVTFFAVMPSVSLGLLPPPTGGLTGQLDHILSQLFGWGKVAVPFAVGAVGVWLMKESFEDRGIPVDVSRVLGVLLLFSGALAWLHMVELFGNVQPTVETFRPHSYALAVEKGRGGGWVGHEIYIFLLSQLLDFGTVSVLLAWMVIGAMLAFNLRVAQIIAYVTGIFGFLHLRRSKEVREARKIAKAEEVPLQRGTSPQPALSAAAGVAAGAAAVAAAKSSPRSGFLGRRKQASAPERPTAEEAITPPEPAHATQSARQSASIDEALDDTATESATPRRSASRPAIVRRPSAIGASASEERSTSADETSENKTEIARPAHSRFGLKRPDRKKEERATKETPLPTHEEAPAAPSGKRRRLPFGRSKRDERSAETENANVVSAANTTSPKPAEEKAGRRRFGLGRRKRGKDETEPRHVVSVSEALATPDTPQAEKNAAEKREKGGLAGRRLGGFLKRRQAQEEDRTAPDVPPVVSAEEVGSTPTSAISSKHPRRPITVETDREKGDAGPDAERRSLEERPRRRSPFGKTQEDKTPSVAFAEAADKPSAEADAEQAPVRHSRFGRGTERVPRSPRRPALHADAPSEAEEPTAIADDTPADAAAARRPRMNKGRVAAFGAAAGAGLAAVLGDADENATDAETEAPLARVASPFGHRAQVADEADEDETPRVPLRPIRPTVSARPARPLKRKTGDSENEETEADVPSRTERLARQGNRPSVARRPLFQPAAPDETPVESPSTRAAHPERRPRRPLSARPSEDAAAQKNAPPSAPNEAASTSEETQAAAAAPTLPLEMPNADKTRAPMSGSKRAPAPQTEPDTPKPMDKEKSAKTPTRVSPPVRRRSTEGRGVSAIAASTPATPARPQAESAEAAGTSGPSARHTPPEWEVPDFKKLLRKGDEQRINDEVLLEKARVIEDTLASFGAPGKVVEVNPGPVITQFGVEPDYVIGRGGKKTRVKVSAIARLDADLALALAAKSIRIEAPVPGKGFVGIEVPNDEISLVGLYDIMESPEFNRIDSKLRLALGLSVDGTPVAADLTAMPHLLIAGTTGSGKSVCVNAIISCLLLQNSPDDLQFIMVDPKRVELTGYNGIPHLVAPVVVELERIVGVLQWIQREMEERYRKFAAVAARNILDYNRKVGEGSDKLPYYVVVVDELADLMMLAPDETERLLARLAQMARATGIHLIISTQRPSVDIITGLIKANFPARIAFAVVSSVDSRVILDQPGAEKLLGRGDMLFQSPDAAAPMRMQGVFVSDDEIMAITRYWKEQMLKRADATGQRETLASPRSAIKFDRMRLNNASARSTSGPTTQSALWEEEGAERSNGSEDALYEEAVELVQRLNKASISLLQRRLRIGYTRAARLIDMMEAEGIVGPAESGSKPREVLKRRVESGDD